MPVSVTLARFTVAAAFGALVGVHGACAASFEIDAGLRESASDAAGDSGDGYLDAIVRDSGVSGDMALDSASPTRDADTSSEMELDVDLSFADAALLDAAALVTDADMDGAASCRVAVAPNPVSLCGAFFGDSACMRWANQNALDAGQGYSVCSFELNRCVAADLCHDVWSYATCRCGDGPPCTNDHVCLQRLGEAIPSCQCP